MNSFPRKFVLTSRRHPHRLAASVACVVVVIVATDNTPAHAWQHSGATATATPWNSTPPPLRRSQSPLPPQSPPDGASPNPLDLPNTPNSSVPLALPQPGSAQRAKGAGGLDPTGRLIMSLATVLGAFFLVAWFSRKRGLGTREGDLPAEAVELLGELPIGGRDTARLLRVGKKLILVSRTSHGLATLTEVTDLEEVQRLTELCHVMQTGAAHTPRDWTGRGAA